MRRAAAPLLAGGLLLVGCTTEDFRDPHPIDRFIYPVAVTVDPRQGPGDAPLLWVTSGNFDLSARGGAVLAVDASTHGFAKDPNGAPLAFQVGGFPGPFEVLPDPEDATRLVAGYVLSRESDALFHVTFDASGALECPGGDRGATGMLECPAKKDGKEVEVPDEDGDLVRLEVGPDPFGALLHRRGPAEPHDLLLTGAMIDGTIGAWAIDGTGKPELYAALDLPGGLFDLVENPVTGRIYASHKGQNALSILEVHPPDPQDEVAPDRSRVQSAGAIVLPGTLVADHARGLALSADGARLYAAYRSPSSLLVLDVGKGAGASPDEVVLAKVPIGRQPGDVEVVPASLGVPELVYVSAFRDDRIDVVDPALGAVVDSIPVGDGPFDLAFLERPDLGIRRLYVTNFHDQSLGVVELDPSSSFFHVQVAEIR